jgi:16S rRNA (adenine1518-N6/adenine1519-N6)-dimethyltransferase
MDVLKKYRIVPNEKLEQVFIVDKELPKELAKLAGINREDIVLDLGAGTGAISDALAKKAKKVIAIEKDGRYYDLLLDRFRKYDNVDVVIDDILKMQLPKFDKVVCNIPYNLYEPFIRILSTKRFKLALLVVPFGMAKILTAKPEDKEYSLFSEFVQKCFTVEKIRDIPKEAFFPEPRVTSSIVRLVPK